jgi:putative inorganic carbon (hco3(-)) transporter
MTTKSETLTFNYRPGDTVTRPRIEEETFATTEVATEPRDWGYLGLLAFTTVLLLRPQDRVPSLTSMHIAEICAFLGIGPMLIHRFTRRLPVFRITPETMGLIVLGVVIVATAPFSVWPGGAIEVFTDAYLKIVIVFVLMMNTLTTTARLERLTWLILLCIGIIAAMSVTDYATGRNLVEGGRLAGPVGGIFGNPNDLAMNMVTFLPATIVVAMSRRRSMPRRMIACGIAALMVATVIFTKSRGGLLGLCAAMAMLVLTGRFVRRGFGTVLVIGAILTVPALPDSFWARMSTIVDSEQDKLQYTGSREARELVMGDGMNTFLEYPITGVGAGQFKNYNPDDRKTRYLETHNVLLQVAAETGIVGLLAFMFLIWRAVVAAWTTMHVTRDSRWRRDLKARGQEDTAAALSEHTLGMTAGLVGWFVCALFASVAYNWTFYYVLALLVAAKELSLTQIRSAVPAKLKKISVRTTAFSTQTA